MSYRIVFTRRFQKDYAGLPKRIQEKVEQQIRRLAHGNFSLPSLRARKMEGEDKTWEASVTMNYRIVFDRTDDLLIFLRTGTHDIL